MPHTAAARCVQAAAHARAPVWSPPHTCIRSAIKVRARRPGAGSRCETDAVHCSAISAVVCCDSVIRSEFSALALKYDTFMAAIRASDCAVGASRRNGPVHARSQRSSSALRRSRQRCALHGCACRPQCAVRQARLSYWCDTAGRGRSGGQLTCRPSPWRCGRRCTSLRRSRRSTRGSARGGTRLHGCPRAATPGCVTTWSAARSAIDRKMSPAADGALSEPNSNTNVAVVSPVPLQIRQGRAQSQCRSGRNSGSACDRLGVCLVRGRDTPGWQPWLEALGRG